MLLSPRERSRDALPHNHFTRLSHNRPRHFLPQRELDATEGAHPGVEDATVHPREGDEGDRVQQRAENGVGNQGGHGSEEERRRRQSAELWSRGSYISTSEFFCDSRTFVDR